MVEEQKYNIINDGIENYVTRIFNGDDAKIKMFMKVADEKGWKQGGSPYSIHRQIALVDDLKGMMPGDFREMNIYKILMKRKIASIEMVNHQKFFVEMQATHGWAKTLIAKAGLGVSAAVRKRMLETRGSIADVSDVHQWYGQGKVNTKKWGFKEGDNKQNLRVLEWLTTPAEARAKDAPWLTDHLRNYGSTLRNVFNFKKDHVTGEVDAIRAIRGLLTDDPLDKMPLDATIKALKEFDKVLRKSEVGPLVGLIPDLETMLIASLKNPAKPTKPVLKAIAELKKPVTGLKKAAQLPEELIIKAKEYRRKTFGILTDITSPGPQVMGSIKSMLYGTGGKRGFGFKTEETGELLDIMFDKRTLDSLTAATQKI